MSIALLMTVPTIAPMIGVSFSPAVAVLSSIIGLGAFGPTVLLCGNEQFMYPIKRILIDELGLDASKICFDDFTF